MIHVVDEELAYFQEKLGPDVFTAVYEDGQYAAELHRIRRFLIIMDLAMEGEEIPLSVRRRIIRSCLFGGPDEIDAVGRIKDFYRKLEMTQHMEVDAAWLRGQMRFPPG